MLTAALAYLLFSPTLATLHIAGVYFTEWRANRKARRAREDEVLMLELLWRSNKEPRV